MELLTEELVREKLVDVIDPELRISIMELGLVYEVDVKDGDVKVLYTLTTPACPLGPVIEGQMKDILVDLPGVKDVAMELTFTPPWDPKVMASDDIKMQLGIW
ncbi:MAG: metal-sulfur cluster assembly factor [Chloroflexi bacterium]|nr:metal-sulfur cluster assembly factor [Chloroflexota bacterium]MCI0849332.1 metal-sulfur cluster assembly factor [Chloroflexota bacterium]